jgi:hypothetical protein
MLIQRQFLFLVSITLDFTSFRENSRTAIFKKLFTKRYRASVAWLGA